MAKIALFVALGVAFAFALFAVSPISGLPMPGWEPLFNGENLDGWRIGDDNPHGTTQAWAVEDGTLVGMQDKPGNGGILLTEKMYRDYVLELEVNPDWDLDSGVFLRSNEAGDCYQITVDNYESGTVGGLYGEGSVGGWLAHWDEWKDHYKQGQWNRILAIVQGNPPYIDVWINGVHAVGYQGEEVKLAHDNHIALQVHAGDKYFGKKARFRNIRVREFR